MAKILLFIFSFFISSFIFSNEIPLEDLTQNDVKDITSEISSNFIHTSVSSTKSLGAVFGFELGIAAGVTSADKIDALIKRADPTADEIGRIPHAFLFGKVSIPLGFSFDMSYLPDLEIDGISLGSKGLGVSYDFNSILTLPFHLGAKLTYTQTDFEFETRDPNTNALINGKFSGKTTGIYAYVSKQLLIVEPYIGLGVVKTDGDLSADVSLFEYTTATKVNSEESSSHLIIGGNFNLILLNLGLEYSRLFDTDRVTAKFNIGF
jgi:hypothetical protein